MVDDVAASSVDRGAALLIAMEEYAGGTNTLSWADISLIMNALFILGWIVSSYFDLGVRWDIAAVLFSNGFGKLSKIYLPSWTRGPLFTLWSWVVHADLDEAEKPRTDYPNLSALFTRALKPGLRPVGTGMVSPVDGTVLVYGDVINGELQSIKGMSYSISQFLGWSEAESAELRAQKELLARLQRAGVTGKRSVEELQEAYIRQPDHRPPEESQLKYCVIYLAPGDYHRIHTPAALTLRSRRHFPGSLFPVAPKAAKWLPQLHTMNERVVLSGDWAHGFFSMAAVGAMNVGSIRLKAEPDFFTNTIAAATNNYGGKNLKWFNWRSLGTEFSERIYGKPQLVHKGEEVATFDFGSTVVLIFESPAGFTWNVREGKHVSVGETIGAVGTTGATDLKSVFFEKTVEAKRSPRAPSGARPHDFNQADEGSSSSGGRRRRTDD
jgi:phosphatidylserine decarboxylase